MNTLRFFYTVERASRLFMAMCYVGGLMVGFSVDGRAAEDKPAKSAKPNLTKLLNVFVSEFVEITSGSGRFKKSFRMGSNTGTASEKPVHTVTFEGHFSMAKYEVPQNLYEAVMGKNPSRWKGSRNSVEMMSWQEAVAFCQKATRLLRDAKLIKSTEEIRLPTEAEWEYCCRAGSTTAYSFGDNATSREDTGKKASVLSQYAWHTGNAAGNDPSVGELKPNAWGLYDMHGYLWEFVADHWQPNYQDVPADGTAHRGSEKNLQRVIRGGSWRDRYEFLKSSTRWPDRKSTRLNSSHTDISRMPSSA